MRRPRRFRWIASTLSLAGIGVAVSIAYGVVRPLPQGPLLEAVKARGKLVVGVRQYARPAPPKAPTAPEPDHFDVAMARFIAGRLGVELQVVGLPGEPGSAVWRAAQRNVDIMVAGATHGGDDMPTVSAAYATGAGSLLVLRGSPYQRASDLRGKTVCVGQGSAYVSQLERETQAMPKIYASSIRAASGFMAGECQALADDEPVIARLRTLQEWRFYRALDTAVQADSNGARIVLHALDPQSTAWLDHAVYDWRRNGALERAREQRAGDIAFEASQLQDGLVCHS